MDINLLVIVLLSGKIVLHILLIRKHKIKIALVPMLIEAVLPVPYYNSIPKNSEAKYSRILLSFLSFMILGFMLLATLVRFGVIPA